MHNCHYIRHLAGRVRFVLVSVEMENPWIKPSSVFVFYHSSFISHVELSPDSNQIIFWAISWTQPLNFLWMLVCDWIKGCFFFFFFVGCILMSEKKGSPFCLQFWVSVPTAWCFQWPHNESVWSLTASWNNSTHCLFVGIQDKVVCVLTSKGSMRVYLSLRSPHCATFQAARAVSFCGACASCTGVYQPAEDSRTQN